MSSILFTNIISCELRKINLHLLQYSFSNGSITCGKIRTLKNDFLSKILNLDNYIYMWMYVCTEQFINE